MAPIMVSIIVPVYNRASCIEGCVLSLINQSYNNIEIILVDDGSSDNTFAVCSSLSKQDKRITTLRNTANGGVSAARNAGISVAHGEYIAFCDSDDTFERDFCKVMLYHALKTDALVLCAFALSKNGGVVSGGKELLNFCEKKDLLRLVNKELINPVVNKIYRTDVIRKNNIRFREDIDMGEDLIFNLDYLTFCNGVLAINKPFYNYCKSNSDSLSKKYRHEMYAVQRLLNERVRQFMLENNIPVGEEYYALYIRMMNNVLKNNMNKKSTMSFIQAVAKNSRILKNDDVIRNIPQGKFSHISPHYIAVYKSGSYAAAACYRAMSSLARMMRRFGKKTVYLKAYSELNFGDDLMVHILLKRCGNIRFVMLAPSLYKSVFAHEGNVRIISKDGFLFRAVNFVLSRTALNVSLEKLLSHSCSGAVYLGGSVFIQPDKNREKILEAFYNFINKRFTAVIGCSFGPYSEQSYVHEYRKAFSYLSDICFRDNYSYDLFSELPNARCEADAAFALDVSGKVEQKKQLFISVIEPGVRHELEKFRSVYIDHTVTTADLFIAQGYSVVIASFCKYEHDERAAFEIFNKLQDKSMATLLSYNGCIDEVINAMRQSEYVMASRHHAVVLGILFGKKVLPIIYSRKTSDMLKKVDARLKELKLSEMTPNGSLPESFVRCDDETIIMAAESAWGQYKNIGGLSLG